jgi:hypothetical protein
MFVCVMAGCGARRLLGESNNEEEVVKVDSRLITNDKDDVIFSSQPIRDIKRINIPKD